MVNTPLVKFFGDTGTGSAPKDYFFDGSTGVYQNANNSSVMIFPTMRRGGRKVYAFNVTNQRSPLYSWSKGCTNAPTDTVCEPGSCGIGQPCEIPRVSQKK